MVRFILIVLAVIITGLVGAIFALQSSTRWSIGDVVQTPDARFENLTDYNFAPNYIDSYGYRLHYVDEGPRDGEVILLLHGQPSWSYLYRHMIPPLAAAGYRVIAPDLVGFGKSDKPTKVSDHSYQMHVDVMTRFVETLELEGVTLFAQDWGGLIGLRIVGEVPDRFARVMISNTGLPAAGGLGGLVGYPLFRAAVWREGQVKELGGDDFSFTKWVAYARHTPEFDFAGLFQQATTRDLSPDELAGYAAPFPDASYLSAVRIFPTLVASQLRQNNKTMKTVFDKWEKPFLTAFGDSDPVTAGGDKLWQERVPGANGQPHTTIKDGAHFIQEDQPEELVRQMIAFIQANP